MKTDLASIAKRSGAIKQYMKAFVPRYEQLFAPVRHEQLTILEIGIGGYKNPVKGGGSLKMWSEYFPNAIIVGLDIHVKQLQLPGNVRIETGSQTDTALLKKLTCQYGGWDIIIDDGSHATPMTITSFETLWPYTKSLYIVEDLHMAKAIGTRAYFEKVKGADFDTLNMCVINKSIHI